MFPVKDSTIMEFVFHCATQHSIFMSAIDVSQEDIP